MDLNKEIYKDLICPTCRERLSLVQGQTTDDDTRRKLNLVCGSCKKVYPVVGRVSCFVSKINKHDKTALSFGFAWKAFWNGLFDKTTIFGLDLSDTADYFLNSLGLTVGDIKNVKIMDAGTGSGRIPMCIQNMDCQVYAVDIHQGLPFVAEKFDKVSNVFFVQAELLNLPFKNGYFDVVWCSGVLHHTPDPKEAFQSIASKVKGGGRLFVSVYGKDLHHYRVFRHLLPFARRLPPSIIYILSASLAVPLYVAFNTSLVMVKALRENEKPPYKFLGFSIENTTYKTYSSIVLNLFDQLHPEFQSEHSVEEVKGWFKLNGFESIVVTESSGMVGVRGIRKLP